MKRKSELSFLNVIFCFLVILIHVLSSPVTNLAKGTWQYGAVFVPWRLSAFVVQGFIFLSGLKLFLTNKKISYGKYCVSRFIQIVIPYLITVVVFYMYFLQRGYFSFSLKDLTEYVIKGDLVSHFYFVIVIVQFYLLKPLWNFMVNRLSPILAIIISVIVMFLSKHLFESFWYNDRIFTSYLAYWVIGCYAGKHYQNVLNHLGKYKIAYMCQFVPFALAEAIFSYRQFVYGGMKFLEELHFVYCVSAILFAFSVSVIASSKVMKAAIFKRIDNASYYIYLIHPMIIFVTDELLLKHGINDTATGTMLRCIATYILSISVSILYLQIKKVLRGRYNVGVQKSTN